MKWILAAFVLGCILSSFMGCKTNQRRQSIKIVSDIPISRQVEEVHVEYKVDF